MNILSSSLKLLAYTFQNRKFILNRRILYFCNQIKPTKQEIINEKLNNQLQQQKIVQKSSNSIDNSNGNLAFCHALPNEWNEIELIEHFDPEKQQIKQVRLVKNRIGQKTGKALIYFHTKDQCDQFIKKYSENFIDAPNVLQRIIVKPFQLKSQLSKLKVEKNMKQVYLANLPFQCNSDELYYLAQDFGEVEYVDLPMQRDGNKNKGYAFVKFKKAEQSLKFRDYLLEHEFMGRKVRAQVQNYEFDTQKKRLVKSSDQIFNQNEENIKNTQLDANMKLYEDLTKESAVNADIDKIKK